MTHSNHLRRVFSLLLFCFLWVCTGAAQNSDDAKEVTTTYFIKNAFVVQKPGTLLPNTSILIKGGLIHSLGPNIEVPFDAKVVDADSMYVYAGFIDACSHTGIAQQEQKDRPRVKDPGNPPKHLAGITPQNTVRNAIGEKLDKSMKDMRELGFGFVHVIPRGRMLPGQGSVLSTGNGKPEQTLIKENISQFAQFKPARRMFPATTIGVMSQFRDLYKNAEYSNAYLKSYNLDPKGLERPKHSEELAALFPVVNLQMPIFFYAPRVKDVNRALILNQELGFNLVLTGVRQGWPLMDEINGNNHGVVLSLHLPEKIEDKSKKEEKKEEKEEDKKEGDEKEESAETKMLREKKKKSHDEYVGQAALFEKRGLVFSFSSLDTKAKDIRSNILRMVEGGLSERGALAALTTNPATLLGISNVAGTIEQGKIANLFVSDKPYFDEDAKIRFMVNDGVLTEIEEKKKKKKGGSNENVSIEGEWKYNVEIPGNTQSGLIVVEGKGDDMKIKVNSDEDPADFTDATSIDFDGKNLTFEILVEGISYAIDINIEGSEFEGNVSVGEFGSFPMTGNLKDSPE
ncbi:MAG: amidohydrolase family protein [Bacteroidota bacterium]